MKNFMISVLLSFTGLYTTAQDISITDSVIYFNNKPVAYYVKELNQTVQHYNVYVISLNKKILIAAQVAEFESPVKELPPFYYYDLIFHNEKNEKDTFAMYYEGQSFVLELATIIKEYQLLDSNKINTDALSGFKQKYNGNTLLLAKIREVESYLNETRFFNEQVVRDRTKPVIILNEKFIMQDGKKIGQVSVNNRFPESSFAGTNFNSSQDGWWTPFNYGDASTKPYKAIDYLLITNRVINTTEAIRSRSDKIKTQEVQNLYNKSLPYNNKLLNPDFLYSACLLIENYLL